MLGEGTELTFPKASGFFALISVFDFSPSVVHTFGLWFSLFLSRISFLKTAHLAGGGGGGYPRFPQTRTRGIYIPILFIYLFFWWGAEERRRFKFGFLLPPLIPFSQSKNPRAAHLGSEGAGTFGSVERGGEVSRCLLCKEGGSGGNS